MDQDIAVKLMMLELKVEEEQTRIPDYIVPHLELFLKKYLNLMYVIGFDAGCEYVYERFGKRTAVIQYAADGTRMAQYPSVEIAHQATKISRACIHNALKTHKKTRYGHYWSKVY